MNAMIIYQKGIDAYKEAKYTKALSLWKTLALKGNTELQYTIAQMYDTGRGVAQNLREAADWYLTAAQNGHAEAQYSIAFMYDGGEGVKKNEELAARWYMAAAQNGHSEAVNCIARSQSLLRQVA